MSGGGLRDVSLFFCLRVGFAYTIEPYSGSQTPVGMGGVSVTMMEGTGGPTDTRSYVMLPGSVPAVLSFP